MASSNLDSMWNLISENEFVLPIESISEDLTCVICKKLLKDAFISGVCGCQYCHKCIREYINNEDKYCPGGNRECKVEFIALGRNVVRNLRVNRSISKLKVNCPNQNCTCNIELIEMKEHLRLCKNQLMDCPYVAIGCNNRRGDRYTIESHLNSDEWTHSELLIELIKSLKNEFNVLKEDSEKRKVEIDDLREESRINKDKIAMLEEDLRNVRNEMQQRLNEELRIEKDAVATMVTGLMKDIDDGFGQSKLEIIFLNEKSGKNEERIASLEEQMTLVKKEGEIIMNEILVTVEREISELRRQREDALTENAIVATILTNPRKESRNMGDNVRDVGLDKCDQLCSNIVGDFLWMIDGLSKKSDMHLYSEPFYSNNYKFCLRLWLCSSSDDIFVYCCILNGDNDDMVEWPMRRALTINIVDQVTMKAQYSVTYKYDTYYRNNNAFDRPKADMNYYIGPLTIEYSSIKKKSSIMVKDSIIVSCAVSNQ